MSTHRPVREIPPATTGAPEVHLGTIHVPTTIYTPVTTIVGTIIYYYTITYRNTDKGPVPVTQVVSTVTRYAGKRAGAFKREKIPRRRSFVPPRPIEEITGKARVARA